MSQSFRANGKLLLTGEYLVLDGAKALAVPTKLGQTLDVNMEPSNQRRLEWKSYNHDGSLWFEALFDRNLQIIHSNKSDVAKRLQNLLLQAIQLNPEFYNETSWYTAETHVEFDRAWGLGSSSTLVSLVAQWANVDVIELARNSFGGSGYDVACATANGPITYQLLAGKPVIEEVSFHPDFSDNLFFYYSGKKQLSDGEVTRYQDLDFDRLEATQTMTELTEKVLVVSDLETLQATMRTHEEFMASIIRLPRAQDSLLPNYQGVVKSLGAWGGDFVLLLGEEIEGAIPFTKMILNGRAH